MATTRLGWDILPRGSSRLRTFPWITGQVRAGDAYTILNELCRRFNNEVEKINPKHSWGHAPRPVRGTTSIASEHSAGTAVDLNAPKHPLGRSGTFTRNQVNAINRILRDLDGSVRWGGNYPGRKDEMHFELQGGVKKLAAVAKKITGGKTSTATTAKPKPPTATKSSHKRTDAWLRQQLTKITSGTSKNSTGHLVGLYQIAQLPPYKLVHDQVWGPKTDAHYRWVHALQVELNKWMGTKIPITKTFDRATFNRVKEWQRRNMRTKNNPNGVYRGTIADGVVGPLTTKPLGIKKYPN